MDSKLLKLYTDLKARGLTKEQEEKVLREIRYEGSHGIAGEVVPGSSKRVQGNAAGFYDYHDLAMLQDMLVSMTGQHTFLRSLDELLEKDKQREEDGFPRKIRVEIGRAHV